MRDFFISFATEDAAWARWIDQELRRDGHSTFYQLVDFRAGGDFVERMRTGVATTRRTLGVLSPRALESEYVQAEWNPALAADPQGKHRKLILVRVAACQPAELLHARIYVDLVGKSEDEARAALLAAVAALPPLDDEAVAFPGGQTTAVDAGPSAVAAPFPGPRLDTTRLPTPGPLFVGRDHELAHLDEAWADPQVNVVSIVAFGGVGKSALVFRWLERLRRDNWRGAARVLAWSFYSQGTQERLASADAFIDFALRWCGDPDPTLGSPRDRGIRLAELIRQQRTLLILDGLEPLQHPPTMLTGGAKAAGRLKDPGIAALLKTLVQAIDGLCVVTTRERVAELAPHEHDGGPARLIEPERLSPEDGAELLRQLEVKGKPEELQAATKEYAGHALTLTLLGSYLRDACAGDVRRRGEIPLGTADKLEGDGHAFRVIAAYEKWLGEGPELAILRLLGLFDRPAAGALVGALRAVPAIRGLTDALFPSKSWRWWRREPLSNEEWQMALSTLRRRGLLGAPDVHDLEALDAHPLVRAYFAERLEQERPDAWRAGHLRLYEHLCRAAPDRPDTLDEMLPLFQAVIHGCRAGRVQEAMDEVYGRRILRGNEHYSWKKLGAFGAELAALAGFFERPWDRPSPQLTPADHAFVLNQAGLYLRALGRLREALQPMQASLDARLAQQDWKEAAACAGNLSESTLTLGDVTRAVAYGRQSVELADRSGNWGERLINRTTLADALHQAGEREQAAALFREAEALQAEWQPQYPRLYSGQGYRYCDVLLSLAEPDDGSVLDGVLPPPTAPTPTAPHPIALPAAPGEGSADGERRAGGDSSASAALRATADASAMRYRQACNEVADRAQQTLAWALQASQGSLLDIALDHLSLGRAHLGLALTAHVAPATNGAQAGDAAATDSTDAEAAFAKAAEHLDYAVECLRKAAAEEFVSRGLITRAAFHRLRVARADGANNARTARAAAAADLTEALDIATRGEMRLHLADVHLEWTRLHVDRGENDDAREHHEQARQLVADTGYHRRDLEVAYLARRLVAMT